MPSMRRSSFLFFTPVLMAAACSSGSTGDPTSSSADDPASSTGQSSAANATNSAPSSDGGAVSAATPAASLVHGASATTELTDWRKAMSKVSLPKDGCFTVTHPSTTWTEVPCVTPPNGRYYVAVAGGRAPSGDQAPSGSGAPVGGQTTGGGGRPQSVGDGNDNASQVSGNISWAEGSFPSVTGVTMESDNGVSDDYSLQLNTNPFTPTLCSHAPNPLCAGVEQFLFVSPGGSGAGTAWIQYWLVDYNTDGKTCPATWQTGGMQAPNNCVKNSTNAVPTPNEPIANLGQLALTGTAGTADSVVLTTATTLYSVSQSSILGLSSAWTAAEFNVLGDSNGTNAHFNSGSAIVVQTLTDSTTPTTNPPSCTSTIFLGATTLETNDLNLLSPGPTSCCTFGGNTPGIQFMESNPAPVVAPTCPLVPVDPNWSIINHPFDSPVVGKDTDGAPLFACRGNHNGSLQVGKTRASWRYCDIGFGGNEVSVSPYESLVGGWVEETGGAVPSNALAFGTDGSGGPTLYSCRAYIDNGYEVGKVRPGFTGCAIPYNHSEITVSPYQVLTSALPLVTLSVSSAAPPVGALIGGYDTDEEPLYACQASFGGGLVPGKTRASWTNCDVGYGGTENHVSNYNVLIPQFKTPGTVFQAGTDVGGSPLGICQLVEPLANTIQVGKYLTSNNTCHFGYSGSEVVATTGFGVLAF
jgi:hypothetical protein